MAAGGADGIFLSRDGGESWRRISPEENAELSPVVALAFDPVHSEVLYAGTTHLPWRTIDGGATWQSIHDGMLDDSDVFSISVNPSRPPIVYASACSGAYRSITAGRQWTRLATPVGAFRTYLVTLDPRHPDTVFAATSAGLLKSSNSGAAFHKVSGASVKSIAFDPSRPGWMYFASTTAGLMVSTDSGETLRESNRGFANYYHPLFQSSWSVRQIFLVYYCITPSPLLNSPCYNVSSQIGRASCREKSQIPAHA